MTQDELKKLMEYDEVTGIFTWKKRIMSQGRINRNAGKQVGHKDKHGYLNVGIKNKTYKVHRLAWLYVHGVMPAESIDHINRITDDNRLINLRSITQSENMKNLKLSETNSSGINGVFWDKHRKRWTARIQHKGKSIFLGRFKNKNDAIEAREEAIKKAEHLDVDKLITEIYDDLASQTCINCSFSKFDTDKDLYCIKAVSIYFLENYVLPDFGCNKFETKG